MAVKKEVLLPPELAPPSAWAKLRNELGIVEAFSPNALEQATRPAQSLNSHERKDLTALEFLTIDPPESMDLDQAMHSEEIDRGGFVVRYAIADVAAFVAPGSELDLEAHQRGVTFYGPDVRVPLYPPVLGEGAASLLPLQLRPAVVWTMTLDDSGELTEAEVERATICSQRRLDYASAQRLVGSDPQISLLATIGQLRHALAAKRGAVDLPTAEQTVEVDEHGVARLNYRASLECERWNAHISLLTGMAAARLMVDGQIGLLRTLPTPPAEAVRQLRLSALALGLNWPEPTSYGEYVTGLDPTDGASAALLTLATRLLRGAGYLAFEGEVPFDHRHSGVAAPYAHCTAPLRRLADRYVNEICLALSAGTVIPEWVKHALPALPEEMKRADGRSGSLQRATVDLAEALVMESRMDETFDAVVVAADDNGGVVQLGAPAVRGRCPGRLELGKRVRVRCVMADVKTRRVEFALA